MCNFTLGWLTTLSVESQLSLIAEVRGLVFTALFSEDDFLSYPSCRQDTLSNLLIAAIQEPAEDYCLLNTYQQSCDRFSY